MKPTKHIVGEEEIRSFNHMRNDLISMELSRKEILMELHVRLSYSQNNKMLQALCDGVNPPIIRVNRGRYCVNPKPVHISRLQTSWDTYAKICNSTRKVRNVFNNITEEIAIAFLKQRGYKILKPTIQYEEVL